MATRSRRDRTTIGLIVVAVLVWAVAGLLAFIRTSRKATPAATVDAGGAATAPSASASTSQPAPSAGEPIDTTACAAALLPPESFKGEPPNLDFICTQTNPLKGADGVRSRLVYVAKGAVTPATRLWAALNWYEIAGFATLRARCCSEPAPLTWPFELNCPLDEAVYRLERAVADGNAAAADEAIALYGKHARCIARTKQALQFKRRSPPAGGDAMLRELLQRAGELEQR